MCPFSNEVAKNDGHDVIIIRPRKDIRARVVHQLVTKQHRQSGVIHRRNEVPYRTDVVDGTFLYVLRNIERGFDTVNHLEAYLLIPRDIRNQYDFCTHADAVAVYAIWLTYKRFLQHRISSYAELYTHSMEKNDKKRYLAIVSKALSIDLDTGSISNIVNPSSIQSLKAISKQ
jgi:hypothetical protein